MTLQLQDTEINKRCIITRSLRFLDNTIKLKGNYSFLLADLECVYIIFSAV